MNELEKKDLIRIFFTADIHNSELVFRKILSIPNIYKPNIIIISGDLTGKAIVPIINEGNERFIAIFSGEKYEAKNLTELEGIKQKLLNKGIYPYVCSKEEVEELKNDPKKLDNLFIKLIVDRIRYWVNMLEEKIPEDIKVIMMPGNDDIFDIDNVIMSSKKVIYPLNKVIEIDYDYSILSLDHVNPTPWNTPREADEGKLQEMIEKNLNKVKDTHKLICNFHCPPYNTKIDLAPKLDKKLRPVYKLGEIEMQHVGSKSIRKFMEKYSPILGLHGHIHESEGYDKIGKTLVLNSGSQYSAGILKGLIIDVRKEGIVRWFKIEA